MVKVISVYDVFFITIRFFFTILEKNEEERFVGCFFVISGLLLLNTDSSGHQFILYPFIEGKIITF